MFVVLLGDGEQVVPAAGVGGQDDRSGGGGGQRPGTQLCPSLILTNYSGVLEPSPKLQQMLGKNLLFFFIKTFFSSLNYYKLFKIIFMLVQFIRKKFCQLKNTEIKI
jgi:hypothetical protein